MDFKERLARLEERRGQTIDEMMAQHRSEMSASVNDELLRLADVLAQASDDEADIVIDAIGGLEHFPSYHTLAETPLFFTGMESASDVLVRIFDRIIAFIKRWIKVLLNRNSGCLYKLLSIRLTWITSVPKCAPPAVNQKTDQVSW